jgi:ppGpp synthetase/RelA/SpoT-type nucleotidyltranferase
MKIPRSIREVYDSQEEKNSRLKTEVDRRILGVKDSRWHYESRVKQLVSFAIKLETGRVANPHALEDFFACTLVLANSSELRKAQRIVENEFDVIYRRPRVSNFTHKKPDAFPFDDLRLYCRLKNNPSLPSSDLHTLIFEVQVKTFLQHAWSIATHDLIYKSDDSNWSQERIAYQVKAMLEHAEVSIQQAGALASCEAIAKEDKETKATRQMIKMLRRHWPADQLPTDLKRLAQNILTITKRLNLKLGEFQDILESQRQLRGGIHPLNLSPYSTVVEYLFSSNNIAFLNYLMGPEEDTKALIPGEISLPGTINRNLLNNAILL